jgi:hypothetical protein
MVRRRQQDHSLCSAHVPHTYPKSGRLCVNPAKGETAEERTAFVVAVADELARATVAHRAAYVARLTVPATGRADIPSTWQGPSMSALWAEYARTDADWAARYPHLYAPKNAPVVAKVAPAKPAKVAPKPATATRTRAKVANVPKPARPRAVTPPAVAPIVIVRKARPTCERCGQAFRQSGVGYQWHVQNRPDCAASLSH